MVPNTQELTQSTPSGSPPRRIVRIIVVLLSLILVSLSVTGYAVQNLNTPPRDFPVDVDVLIPDGSTISDVADSFAIKSFVRSGLLLYITLETEFRGESIKAGVYRFESALNTLEIAKAITTGTHVSPPLTVTFPEGFRVSRMPDYLPERFAATSTESYAGFEGYLFPDTYFVGNDSTLDELVGRMRKNFDIRTVALFEQYENSKLTREEVITLASIVEREANDETSMRTVAGILLNRITLGMPLQVDATLDYLLGKTSQELTEEDLRIDSPYNTYVYAGLPPGPICNPGLLAIQAVLEPEQTDFLYYLTGLDGTFHYAKTFEEHKMNKARYLR